MKNKFKIERNVFKRYAMQNTLKYEIAYIFRSAKKHKYTFEAILKSVRERIYDSHSYKSIGNEGRANIRGHTEAQFTMKQDELEWSCWYDGRFMGLTKYFEYGKHSNLKLMETGYTYKGTKIRYNEKTKENDSK